MLQKVKDALNARGAKTIRSLGKVFRALDSYDGNKKVDGEEFYVGLQEIGVSLTRAEAAVFKKVSYLILFLVVDDAPR